MATTFDARAYLQDINRAFNEKDPEPLLRHYAENAEISDPTTRQPLRGKDGVRQNLRQWTTAMGETTFTLREAVTSPTHVALLMQVRARHTGEMELAPGERIPATNKPVQMDLANFLTLDAQGKIVKDQLIFDVAGMMTQLGLMPGAGQGAAERGRMPAR